MRRFRRRFLAMENKLYNALGLCRRAGRCLIGDFACEKAVKGGKAYMTVEPPLIVYDAAGQYTEEIRSIYGGEDNV